MYFVAGLSTVAVLIFQHEWLLLKLPFLRHIAEICWLRDSRVRKTYRRYFIFLWNTRETKFWKIFRTGVRLGIEPTANVSVAACTSTQWHKNSATCDYYYYVIVKYYYWVRPELACLSASELCRTCACDISLRTISESVNVGSETCRLKHVSDTVLAIDSMTTNL